MIKSKKQIILVCGNKDYVVENLYNFNNLNTKSTLTYQSEKLKSTDDFGTSGKAKHIELESYKFNQYKEIEKLGIEVCGKYVKLMSLYKIFKVKSLITFKDKFDCYYSVKNKKSYWITLKQFKTFIDWTQVPDYQKFYTAAVTASIISIGVQRRKS